MQLQGQFDTGVEVGRNAIAPKRAEPGRSGVRSLAARVLTVALLAALAALLALPVQAQTTLTTFISNTSASVDSTGNAFYQAMSFEFQPAPPVATRSPRLMYIC